MPHNFTTATKGAWLLPSVDTLIPIAIEDCVFTDENNNQKKSLFLSADHPIFSLLFDDIAVVNTYQAHLKKKLKDASIREQLLKAIPESTLVVANINDANLGVGEEGKGQNRLGLMLTQAREQVAEYKKNYPFNAPATELEYEFTYTDQYERIKAASEKNTIENFKRELGKTEGCRFYDTQTDAAQKKKFLEDVLKGGAFKAHHDFVSSRQGTTFQNTHEIGFSAKSGAPTGVSVNENTTEFSLTHKKGRGNPANETVYEFSRLYDDKTNTADHTIKVNPQSKTSFRLSFDEMTDAYHLLAVTDHEMRRKAQANLANMVKDKIQLKEEQALLASDITATTLSVEDYTAVPTIKSISLPGREPSIMQLKDSNGKEVAVTAKQAAALTAFLQVYDTVHFKLNDQETLTLSSTKKIAPQIVVGNASQPIDQNNAAPTP